MRRDLERRLRAIEIARAGPNIGGVLIEHRDGMLRAPWGETAVSFYVAGESGPMTWHAKALTTSYLTGLAPLHARG